jgi:hypothetical protein
MVVPTATNETDLTDVSFTATWTAPEIGIYDNYLLYVATDQNFTNTLTGYNPKVLNNNVYTELISGLSSNTNYYYRLQAQNNNFVAEAAFSNTIQVTTKLILNISASVNPVNSGNITGTGNYDYNTTCELVATPQTGYNFVNWTENGTEVSTNATYSFTVTQDSSVVANFTFTSSIAENEYHNIVIYPNPTDNYLCFSNLESEKLMSIKIYNIFGQSVLNFSDFDADKIDVSNLVKGIYFVEIKNENEKIIQKMIKK